MNQPDAAVRLANRFQSVYRFSRYSVCSGFRSPQYNCLQGQSMCFYMVGAVGIEPTTNGLKVHCSSSELYPQWYTVGELNSSLRLERASS